MQNRLAREASLRGSRTAALLISSKQTYTTQHDEKDSEQCPAWTFVPSETTMCFSKRLLSTQKRQFSIACCACWFSGGVKGEKE
jgi:hypothetical protein